MDTTIGNAIDVSSGKIGFSFIKVSFIISSLITFNISSQYKNRHTTTIIVIVWRKMVTPEKSIQVLASLT